MKGKWKEERRVAIEEEGRGSGSPELGGGRDVVVECSGCGRERGGWRWVNWDGGGERGSGRITVFGRGGVSSGLGGGRNGVEEGGR